MSIEVAPLFDREELHLQLEQDKADARALIDTLLKEELLDEDGYPTTAALDIVETWHWSDPRGWFDFIKSVWYSPDWGWKESDVPHTYRKDETVHQYQISTAGWSGNEAIIRAMQENEMMWHVNWVQSRRGGHYIFELYEFKE